MNNLRIKARTILEQPIPTLWRLLRGRFTLVMDDGEIPADWKGVIISRHVWRMHEIYKHAPMLKRHYLTSVMTNGHIQPGTFTKLYNSVYWDVVDSYKDDIRDDLSLITYQVANSIYNDFVIKMEKYVTGFDIIDMVEVANHPRIREALATIPPTPEGIERLYKVAKDVIHNDPVLATNRQVIDIKAGLVNELQALQCLVAVGIRTDIDSSIFPIPIMRPYIAGMRTPYESLVDSRSAAISLSSSQGPLQQSEYTSRGLQLQDMPFRNLHRVDCGSEHYLEWMVTKDVYNNFGIRTEKGNFKNLIGKKYIDENGNIETLKPDDKHLIGRRLRFRSMIAGCMHEDPSGVCAVCYGGLSDTLPLHSNISHTAISLLMRIFGQGILSLKHRIGSALVDAISFDDFTAKYLRVGKGGNTYYFTDEVKKFRTVMVIPKEAIPGIVDLRDNSEHIQENITRLSKFDYLQIDVYRDLPDGTTQIEHINLQVHSNKRHASFTTEALTYIRSEDFEITDQQTYEIELSEWPLDKPALVLPLIQYSISEHVDEVAKVLESSAKELKRREMTTTPISVLTELFDLVNSRLDVNLAILEAVLYGGMVVSISGHDYALPKPWTKGMAGSLLKVVEGRSITGPMCYEGHSAAIDNIDNFIYTNRFDHPMDVYFSPVDALENEMKMPRP